MPNLPSADSDLLLMELGVSHFIRLELATESQISTPFIKEIAQMARNVVERARSGNITDSTYSISEIQQPPILGVPTSGLQYSTVAQNEFLCEADLDVVCAMFLG